MGRVRESVDKVVRSGTQQLTQHSGTADKSVGEPIQVRSASAYDESHMRQQELLLNKIHARMAHIMLLSHRQTDHTYSNWQHNTSHLQQWWSWGQSGLRLPPLGTAHTAALQHTGTRAVELIPYVALKGRLHGNGRTHVSQRRAPHLQHHANQLPRNKY